MPILFEYEVVQRTTRHTSGHEGEELRELFKKWADDRWRLHTILPQTTMIQILIFEREKKNEQQGGAA